MFKDVTLLEATQRTSFHIERMIVKNSRKIFFILVGCGIVFIFIFCLLWIFVCGGRKSAEYGVMRKIIRVLVWNENGRNKSKQEIVEHGKVAGLIQAVIWDKNDKIVLERTSCMESGNHTIRESEQNGNSYHIINMLESRQRFVLEEFADQLSKMYVPWPKKERVKEQVIYPSYWDDTPPYGEESFPEKVIAEIVDAFRENTLMEFINTHTADYRILSSEEIRKYAAFSDTVYSFIDEMEYRNSYIGWGNNALYKRREEEIKKISETNAIWYMLPLDRPNNIVVYGKYETYKFDLRGLGTGLTLASADELYFISWGESNLIIETEENLENVMVFYFNDVLVGNIAVIKKDEEGKVCINYYGIEQ